jgi:cell division protein FtsB
VRWLAIALLVVIVLLQHPLWLGKGGWLRVWEVDRQLAEQKEINKVLELRNAALDAEVRDLKQGYDAIEERARFELGMVKQGEVFVQIPEKPAAEPRAALLPEKAPAAPVARAAAAARARPPEAAAAKVAANKPAGAVAQPGRPTQP